MWGGLHQVLTRAKPSPYRVEKVCLGPILRGMSKTFLRAISARGAVENARKTKPTWDKDAFGLKTFLLRRFCKNSG